MSRIKIKNLDDVLKELERMEVENFQVIGEWDGSQHLSHCAQAIQFSMIGYPIEKPALMQHTIGKLAFHIFNARGYMSHNTNALTPGAPENKSLDFTQSMQRMRSNIIKLLDWDQPLYPHEFYGELSKKEHIRAHSMHFANHFEKFKFV